MKAFIIIYLLASLTLISCDHLEKSKLMHEHGYVIEKQFIPEVNLDGSGVTSDGKVVFTHSHEDQKFTIAFKCQHGSIFTVNNLNVYQKINKGDSVKIDYYELLDHRGTVKDFDFVDANKLDSISNLSPKDTTTKSKIGASVINTTGGDFTQKELALFISMIILFTILIIFVAKLMAEVVANIHFDRKRDQINREEIRNLINRL